MEIAIISTELFKEYGPIKEDTVITKFIPYVLLAQKAYIRPLIGDALLTKLQLEVKDNVENNTPIPPDSQALIIEIAPVLSFYAIYQGLPLHWASIQNKGMTARESENSNAIPYTDMQQMRIGIRADAQTFGNMLVDYLKRCRGDYPLWVPPPGCGCDPAPLTGKTYDFGINVPPEYRR